MLPVDEYWPAAQAKQLEDDEAPVTDIYVPAIQLLQLVEAPIADIYVPAIQLGQIDIPVVIAYWPARQG